MGLNTMAIHVLHSIHGLAVIILFHAQWQDVSIRSLNRSSIQVMRFGEMMDMQNIRVQKVL